MVMGCQGGLGTPRRWLVAESDRAEKITINVGIIDLGQIDLLVREGFYTNRTDFIRNQLRQAARRSPRPRPARRWSWALGLASIGADVTPELALATIASVEVLGAFRASPAVKAALAPRTA
jgi:Arc/MetJ-type ribon-helix-helix transcriptional regulator